MKKGKLGLPRQHGLEQFYVAVEQAGDAIFIGAKDGKIEYVNPAFEKLTGFSKEEAIGKTPRIVKSGLQPLSYYKKLWSTILSGNVFRSTVINRKKSGELFYADHTITPLKNREGEVVNFIAIWKDITASKELEKKKDDFIGVASHELKTPITAIKAYSQILKKQLDKFGDKKSLYMLSKLSGKVDMLTNLVNELLDVKRIEEDRLVFTKRKFDLHELIEKTVIDFEYMYEEFEFVERGDPVFVKADKERIEQVLINLIINAIKYSPTQKKVVIKVEEKEKDLVISIADSGIGIPESKIDKVFERFYRAENKGVGFGLGLYISSEIITRHGGKMWVKSQTGKGSTFFFSLPIN